MKPLDTLVSLRKAYPTPMSNAQLGELLNAVAWAHRAEGWGVLKKPDGANCQQPRTGAPISRDILALPDGRIFDVLIDAEGKGTPTWGKKKNPVNPNRWLAPVDSTGAVPAIAPDAPSLPPSPQPLSPPQPPPAPQHVTQPYPDESTWWPEVFQEMVRLYAQADRPQDPMMFQWSTRIAYDIGAGMPKEQAMTKHIAELRAALGL